jgi:uncharacterized protein YbbC (DUF1343 family)
VRLLVLLSSILFYFSLTFGDQAPKVRVGSESLFNKEYSGLLKGKKIGLITNHTAINSRMQMTWKILEQNAAKYDYSLVALFAPEHGLQGEAYAGEMIDGESDFNGIPVYSLHGITRRPTEKMLKNIDLLIYDIQDIGSRSYTYISTLFFAMEEASKQSIPVLVLDRPNPINGIMIDGPMLEEKWRSFVGYVNVPYCHGMTIGELAQFFNSEYKIGCKLQVIPMQGWNRRMSFSDTGLVWIPPSPNIPESSTALFYPTTGFLGELGIVNIGIGYTLPFKIVGAPWIDANQFSQSLNKQKFPGVYFEPFHYRPFYGKFAKQNCQGVLIVVTNPQIFQPVTTQYMIFGILKSLYSKEFKKGLDLAKVNKEMFDKVNGSDEIYRIMKETLHIVWPLKSFHFKEREKFKDLRQKYLHPDYANKGEF